MENSITIDTSVKLMNEAPGKGSRPPKMRQQPIGEYRFVPLALQVILVVTCGAGIYRNQLRRPGIRYTL